MRVFGKTLYLSAAACLLCLSAQVHAAGLSTTCGAIELENLKIGQSYSLRSVLGYPFNATYRGGSMAELDIKISVPSKNSPDGFEPLNDTSWIRIEKDKFALDPGQTAETDIYINIPNDQQYMGKRYYFRIVPQSSPAKGATGQVVFGTALWCTVKLTIAAKPPTAEEIRQLKKQLLGQIMNFSITPERIFVNEIELGKKYDLKKDFDEIIKIVNTSDISATALVSSIPIEVNGFFPPNGYTEPGNPNWLIVKKKKLTLKENSINEIPLELSLPPKTAVMGDKYYFIVAIDVQSKIRTSRYLTKVYVDTKPLIVDSTGTINGIQPK